MSTDIIMPNMGFDAQEGRLVSWLKQPGDSVVKGDLIAIIESDKASVELESVASGTLLAHLCEEGAYVPVGAAIARIGDPSEVVPTPPEDLQPAGAGNSGRIEASPVARRLAADNDIDLKEIAGSGPRGRIQRRDVELQMEQRPSATAQPNVIRALPKVRRAAREAGIDLAGVTASGPRGDITLADLAALQSAPGPEPAAVPQATPVPPAGQPPAGARMVPISRGRERIGQRLGASKRDAPHFYVTGEFDLEAALTRLETLPGAQPRVNDLIQYLTVQALRQVPELNATFKEGQLYHYDSVNLAIAVALSDGLITPVIQNADRYSLTGLAAESRELIQRARSNRLTATDLQPGTFTISNLGVIKQVDHFTAVINPPQVAILAVGTVKQRPVVVNGGLHVHHTVHLTLSGDHRVVDGIHLGRFMAAFEENLQHFRQE